MLAYDSDVRTTPDDRDLSPELLSAIEQATARLQQELGGRLASDTISSQVGAALDELRDARIKTYVPVLTYRIAWERLRLLLDAQR